MVVAVDEHPGRKVYTIDDGSGACLECMIDIEKPSNTANNTTAVAGLRTGLDGASTTSTVMAKKTPKIPDDVDVGTVVDVKGGLMLFRRNKQIKILKATVLRSTEQEVVFWEKIRQFRRDTLDMPWKLTEREIRRCRKDEERRR